MTGGGIGYRPCNFCCVRRDGAAGVALIDVTSEGLEIALANVNAASSRPGFRTTTHVLDITNKVAVRQTLERIYELFGRIDYAVRNAGVCRGDEGGLAEATTETWRKMIGVDLGKFGLQHILARSVASSLRFHSYHIIITDSTWRAAGTFSCLRQK